MNIIIPDSKCVVGEAIKLAQEITTHSPDAVQATKHGLLLAQNLGPIDAVQAHIWSRCSERLFVGENMKEGLRAFADVCAQKLLPLVSFTFSSFFLFFFISFFFNLIPVLMFFAAETRS